MDPNDVDMIQLQYPHVPSHTIQALENYWLRGWEPGSFLAAALAGDLYQAAARADKWNKDALGHIAVYIAREAPDGSWGSLKMVRDWCNHGEWFQRYEKQRVLDILSK
jgi:hypothetical protein